MSPHLWEESKGFCIIIALQPTDCLSQAHSPVKICHAVQNYQKDDNFVDSRTSNLTWVAFEYNAGLAGVAAALNQATRTYDQCLQGFGIFSSEGAICDNNSNTASNKR